MIRAASHDRPPELPSGDPYQIENMLRAPDASSCPGCGAPVDASGDYAEPAGHDLDALLVALWHQVAIDGPRPLFVLLARVCGGQSFAEIGAALGMSGMGACKSALKLSRKFPELRPLLSRASPGVQRAAAARNGCRRDGHRFIMPDRSPRNVGRA